MTPLEALKQKRAQKAAEMAALVAAVQAESRAMTDKENTQFTDLDAEIQQLEASIVAFERSEQVQASLSAPGARVVPPIDSAAGAAAAEQPGRAPIKGTVVAHRFANNGFEKGIGEYLLKVRESNVTGKVDPRLMVNAVTTWAGESVGADGGWALPPEFVRGIMSLVNAEDSFVRALNAFPTQSDIITIPKDEDAPWTSTAGVQAAKTAEAGAITPSKIAVGQTKVVMYGVKSLVHVDEKSLRDMAFLGAYVERKMGEKIRWKVENYCLNGTGDNEPLGILNAPGLLSYSDSNSTATSLGAEDVMAMEALSLMGAGGFWIAHPTVLPLVRTLKSGTGGYPLYTFDMKEGVGGGLLGYPVFKSFAAKTLNTLGDILFVKPDGYFLAFEQGGPQNATTIAFAFDQNLQSFRSTLYMGGAPSLSAKVLLPDGSTYVSNLIGLAGSRS
jgi:HK97 family phage major capsid protein